MFSLDNSMRYWFYNSPVNMRMGFNGLSGIVNNKMGMNIRDGDVFVFVNASRNRMKILHRESWCLILYALSVEMGRMRLPFSGEQDEIASSFCYEDVVNIARSAMDSPYVRRMKMLSRTFEKD